MAYPALITDLTFIRGLLVVCEYNTGKIASVYVMKNHDHNIDQIVKITFVNQNSCDADFTLLYIEEN